MEGGLTALVGNGKRFAWDPTPNSLTELAADAENGRVGRRGQASTDATDRQPSRTGAETSTRFVNRLTGLAEVFWKRTGSQFRWPAPTWSRPAVLRSGVL